MDNNDLKKALLQAFSEEAPELLQKAQMALLDLESAIPGQCGTHLNALKRALHSMKGSASAIGRSDIRDVSHAMENLFVDGGESAINAGLLDKLYAGLSFIAEGIKAPAMLADSSDLLAFLAGIDNLAMPQQQVPAPAPAPAPAPTPTPVLQAETPQLIGKQPASALAETIRVSVGKIENMQSSLSDLVAIRLLQKDSHEKMLAIQQEITAANKLWRQLKNDMAELRSFLPHQASSRLNARMSDYSSQVKNIQRSAFHLTKQIGSQAGQLNLLSDEIDHGLRSIRMVPIGPFLESYRTVARDAARQLNKSVNLECIDRGIEIDRLIMEKIKEPILHIVRNCVSHGIELPAVRNALGKPEAGTIQVMAEVSGDYVHIRIIDDGSGFDRRRIAEQAIRLGLLKADDEIDGDNILDIVSRPGFSTARQADMVSGRGVGMDVVVTQLAELGGELELETEEGLGSCFTLRVPSSLAISQGLILRIGDRCFGVVLDAVERIVRTRIAALGSIQGKQVVFVNDDPVAVSSLATVLGYTDLEPKNAQTARPLVILRQGSQRLALLVDDVPGEIPMVIKSLGPQFEHVRIYTGGAILSDGNVLPVLDARCIIKMVAENGGLKLPELPNDEQFQPVVEQFAMADKSGGTIIVVDDSITTRTLERNILEAAGFKVAVATDGIEALDLLMQEDNIALLVTDMEMPRMNGIELCRNIRAGRHAELPIIMVTSVGNADDMKKGIQAGADAYIVKGDFQQEHFLETVRRFVRR